MVDPTEQLRHALAQADIATAALRFLRPAPAQQSALRALHEVDGALRTVLAALGRGQADALAADGEDLGMHRRLLLKLSGLMSVAAVAPLEALDRLVAQRGRAVGVDRTIPDAYQALLHG